MRKRFEAVGERERERHHDKGETNRKVNDRFSKSRSGKL